MPTSNRILSVALWGLAAAIGLIIVFDLVATTADNVAVMTYSEFQRVW